MSTSKIQQWRATLLLEQDEGLPALLAAFEQVWPGERIFKVTFGWEDDPESAYITLRVPGSSEADARERAERVHAEARERAGLAPQAAQVTGLFPPWMNEPDYETMSLDAHKLLEDKRYEFAVLRAQTGLELYIRLMFEQLLGVLEERVIRTVNRNASTLRSENAQALFFALTGKRPTDAPGWSTYVEHVGRRNQIIHEGQPITEHEAHASLDAVHAMHGFVRDAWLAARGFPPADAEL